MLNGSPNTRDLIKIFIAYTLLVSIVTILYCLLFHTFWLITEPGNRLANDHLLHRHHHPLNGPRWFHQQHEYFSVTR